MSITVVLVDDSDVVRRGLVALLETDPDIDIVGHGRDGDEALTLVKEHRPDVVLLDVRMPRRDGLSVVPEIATATKVLMLTFTDDDQSIRRALADGAAGYLVHGTFDADSLTHLIRATVSGAGAFSGPALEVLRSPAEPRRDHPRATHGLSPRQCEVMDLIAAGHGNVAIARELFLAEKTVKNHINTIFAQLGVQTRAHAIVLWLDRGPSNE